VCSRSGIILSVQEQIKPDRNGECGNNTDSDDEFRFHGGHNTRAVREAQEEKMTKLLNRKFGRLQAVLIVIPKII
jgi:hypothetical protein